MIGSFLHFLDDLATPRDPFDVWGIMDYVFRRQGQQRLLCYNVNNSVKFNSHAIKIVLAVLLLLGIEIERQIIDTNLKTTS